MSKTMKIEKNRCQQIVDEMMLQISRIKEIIEFFFVNHEYKENIGTIYKGSINESKDFLRFKQRFKKKILIVASWHARNLCTEAI